MRGDIALMITSAERAAAATDAALPIATAVVEALRAANIMLPMPSTIERAGIAGRARARKTATRMMIADLSPEQIGSIDALFDEQDGARLGWLKTVPVATKADSVRNIVERLRVVRAIGIPCDAGAGVHPNRRHQFVQEGRLSPAYLGAPQGLSYGQRQSEQMVNKSLSVAAKYIKFRGFVRLDELEVTGSPLVMFHPRSS